MRNGEITFGSVLVPKDKSVIFTVASIVLRLCHLSTDLKMNIEQLTG